VEALKAPQSQTLSGKESTSDQANFKSGLSKKMGRILAKRNPSDHATSGVKKITLRRNSIRRSTHAPENEPTADVRKKFAKKKSGLPPKHGLPPKVQQWIKQAADQRDEEESENKRKFQPFSLVFLKRKAPEAAETA